jgi:hypothetical protein
MRANASSRSFLLMAILLAVSIAPGVRADDGRDFAGFYELTDVVDRGVDVSLTLTVRIFNYSGGDVTSARVIVDDSLLPGRDYGSFPPIDLGYLASGRIAGSFVVSGLEYQSWDGSAPRLSVEFIDSNGQPVRRSIELLRISLESEGV